MIIYMSCSFQIDLLAYPERAKKNIIWLISVFLYALPFAFYFSFYIFQFLLFSSIRRRLLFWLILGFAVTQIKQIIFFSFFLSLYNEEHRASFERYKMKTCKIRKTATAKMKNPI